MMAIRRPSPVPSFVRIVLVGFMGAGKSTVGPLLADALGWSFVDLDDEIEVRTGELVPVLVQRDLAAFRRLESAVGREILLRDHLVLAVGGGWASTPGNMDGLGPQTTAVWLHVEAATALARVRASPVLRPLLEVEDPLGRAEGLLEERMPHYGRSGIRIDTEGRLPGDIVEEILGRLQVERT